MYVPFSQSLKARERELANVDENWQQAGGALNPMRHKNAGMYRDAEGKTPVTSAFVQKAAEGKMSQELSW